MFVLLEARQATLPNLQFPLLDLYLDRFLTFASSAGGCRIGGQN
jgi:hypothetical protein